MSDAADGIFLGVRAALQGGAPLYLQLKKSIEQAVDSGLLGPGDALPSERDIAVKADVSRVTVRKAVQDLVRGGVLVQRHGSGTFVAARVKRVEQSLSRLTSFTEDMARRGMAVRSAWLDRGLYAPRLSARYRALLKPPLDDALGGAVQMAVRIFAKAAEAAR